MLSLPANTKDSQNVTVFFASICQALSGLPYLFTVPEPGPALSLSVQPLGDHPVFNRSSLVVDVLLFVPPSCCKNNRFDESAAAECDFFLVS